MQVASTFLTQITPAPYVAHDLLVKRAVVTCGNLGGAYSNVQAPVCSGSQSICTFSNALQGCCDSAGSCQFYTTCQGGYDSASCAGSSCLGCGTATPYCVKYNFWDSASANAFYGFSCAGFDPGDTTIYGAAASIVGGTTITSATATSSSSSHTSSPSTGTSSSASSSRPSTGTLASATASSSPSATPTPDHPTHTGAIVGGIVGGVGGAALLAAIAFFIWRRYYHADSSDESVTDHEPQSNWNDERTRPYSMTQVPAR